MGRRVRKIQLHPFRNKSCKSNLVALGLKIVNLLIYRLAQYWLLVWTKRYLQHNLDTQRTKLVVSRPSNQFNRAPELNNDHEPISYHIFYLQALFSLKISSRCFCYWMLFDFFLRFIHTTCVFLFSSVTLAFYSFKPSLAYCLL